MQMPGKLIWAAEAYENVSDLRRAQKILELLIVDGDHKILEFAHFIF